MGTKILRDKRFHVNPGVSRRTVPSALKLILNDQILIK